MLWTASHAAKALYAAICIAGWKMGMMAEKQSSEPKSVLWAFVVTSTFLCAQCSRGSRQL